MELNFNVNRIEFTLDNIKTTDRYDDYGCKFKGKLLVFPIMLLADRLRSKLPNGFMPNNQLPFDIVDQIKKEVRSIYPKMQVKLTLPDLVIEVNNT